MTDNLFSHLEGILEEQLSLWPAARRAFHELDSVMTRSLVPGGPAVQFNPARIQSTVANLKPAGIASRPCFLCAHNRPKEQSAIDLGTGFELAVNPYPILKQHFCVISIEHRPQRFSDCCGELLRIAGLLPHGYMIFYNGPRSGASAPDHLHMQLGLWAGVPLAEWLQANAMQCTGLNTVSPLGFPVTVLADATTAAVKSCVDLVPVPTGEYEPRMNVVAMNVNGHTVCAIIRRTHHRPSCFYQSDDQGRCVVSPGAIDMCGLLITPRREDFDTLDADRAAQIFSQVTPAPPTIRVGIMAAPKINATYNPDGTFTLHDVTIGKQFHWQRLESQTFRGQLETVHDAGLEWAVNRIGVEEYLESVISSEMKATAPLEFLKAHAVISRSWVLAQLKGWSPQAVRNGFRPHSAPGRIIKWYDHDQHSLFDVCADDHCQRYQGITRIISPQASRAVHETRGQVLLYDGHLCDARFSKCCGGQTELFSSCWQDTDPPYLKSVADPYCGKATPAILGLSMNSYDIETGQFHNWQVRLSQQELSRLFLDKTGIDVGMITNLEPVSTGPSGRIVELLVTGTQGSVVIGKELEIRRALSPTHLLSSAFSVSAAVEDGRTVFTLTGKGWGHGVGLCQTGAAVMASLGMNYMEILEHYYPGSTLGNCL